MKERRKNALTLLAIATPMLAYGAFTFEIGGAASTAEAMTKSMITALGLVGVVSGLVMFFTKNSLGLIETKTESDSRRIRSPEELINLTIDDEFNKLRAKATSVDSKEPKPITKKEKEMSKIKDAITKEKPVEKSGSESIGMMLREKELVKRSDELNALVNEVETELSQVRENLETKGWVNSDDGWVIE